MSLDICAHGFDLSKGECSECLPPQAGPEITGPDDGKDPHDPGSSRPAGDPFPEPDGPDGAKSASTSHSKIEYQNIFQSGNGTTIFLGPPDPSGAGEFKPTSLYDESTLVTVETYEELDIDVRQYVDNLKKYRILILGDSGDGYAYRFAMHVLSSLNIRNRENARLLRIVDIKSESPGMDSFSFERAEHDKDSIQETFVIVDASKGAGSLSFADSLLNPRAADIYHYPSVLRENKFCIIFLLKKEDIESWTKKGVKGNFPLKVFPRKAASHQPEEDVDDIRIKVGNIFKSNDQIDFLIIRTVCFVAAFFPGLTNGNFNELVNDWLKLESVSLDTVSSDGATKDIAAKYTSLDRIWKTKSHSYTESCFLIEKRVEGKRIIDFKSEPYRELIKKTLEDYHWAFIEEKVTEIRKLGLIFNSSNNIAYQSMSLYVNYIPGNEEKLLNWLLLIFDALNSTEKDEAKLKRRIGIPDSDSENDEETAGRYYYYERLEEFFRKILHQPDLTNLVSAFIERLLKEGCSQSALKIVKRLRSASGFDDVWWLKQIYERGNDAARKEIKKYFFRKIANSGFEEAVDKLNAWLPAEDAPAGKYSKFSEMALNLFVEYYADRTEKYDEKLYGVEPTQFSLLAFRDRKTTEIRIDKIVRYLLHPANLKFDLKRISYAEFVAMLLEIWNKILCENNYSKRNSHGDKQKIRNKEIIDLILEKVILYSDKEFQENVNFSWKKMSDGYQFRRAASDDWETSEKLIHDYEMIENLREDFADLQWKDQ